jgi:tryptophan halogenase
MALLLRQLDIDEAEFMRRCNASFKCGVRFKGWSFHDDGRSRDFIHPFNAAYAIPGGHNPAYHFHRFAAPDGATDLVDRLVPNAALIADRRGPRRIDQGNYEQAIGYSYHLDASLFAEYLREICLTRGVTRIVDDVVDVVRGADGAVTELRLERSGSHEVEFVVDCTGFRSLILGEALDEPFESWGGHLLCDRALALQLEHVAPETLDVCTGATALGAGWVWNVPLFTRVGTGYVFSSAFRSDDEARDEFVTHLESLGHRVTVEPRTIAMRLGRRRRGWVKNCVAVGLSSAFIEPLEATAIYTIDMTIRHLVHHFPDRGVSPELADGFNRQIAALQANILDFIVMHYVTSNRGDPFWLAARADVETPATLARNLAIWKHVLPGPGDTPGNHLFNDWSYLFCLYGKGYFDGIEFPAEGSVHRADWSEYTRQLDEAKHRLIQGLPSHRDLMMAIHRAPVPAGSRGGGTVGLPGAALRPAIAPGARNSGVNR